MNISFIITTFNIASYIEQCLNSLKPCLRAGDQVIVVDDGSTDNTAELIRKITDRNGLGSKIEINNIELGTNTIGGVGIPANIGMSLATRDIVFFVDGDDYLVPNEFLLARAKFEASNNEIMFCNYLEYDQLNKAEKPPADAKKWSNIPQTADAAEIRLHALSMIAVPWRKFYRRDFLTRNNIRFPEGDFFFEDNPFHWQVCRLASSIGFDDRVICHHRVNRPGQTMTSTGAELTAFFTHYHTIVNSIPPEEKQHLAQAARWIINQISWHVARLQPNAYNIYAMRAHRELAAIDDDIWNNILQPEFLHTNVWRFADQLRQGYIWKIVDSWLARDESRKIADLNKKLDGINKKITELEKKIDETNKRVDAANKRSEKSASILDKLQRDVGAIKMNTDAQRHTEEFKVLKQIFSITSIEQDKGHCPS